MIRRFLTAALLLAGASLPLAAQGTDRATIEAQLAALRRAGGATAVPAASQVATGSRRIGPDDRIAGPVAVSAGDVDVYGEVKGDAIALGGDVIVHVGGHVTGDAVAVDGKVRLEGGRVDGEVRTLSGARDAAASAAAQRAGTKHSPFVAVGWLVVLLLVGMATLVLAGPTLDGVATELEKGFGRALLVGVLAELALAPVLALTIVGLVLTILGILLVPFAIVAYVLAAIGLFTLGGLAVARLTGEVLTGGSVSRRHSAMGASLRALVAGIALLVSPWLLASLAGMAWGPAEWILRLVAVAVAWVASTAGFGATLLSRVGTRGASAPLRPQVPADQYGWQTPTPVTGVAAARRPVSTGTGR